MILDQAVFAIILNGIFVLHSSLPPAVVWGRALEEWKWENSWVEIKTV